MELYINIFGYSSGEAFTDEEQYKEFFDRFAPWENEQFACVHYHLLIQVANGMLVAHQFAFKLTIKVLRIVALKMAKWTVWCEECM